MKILYLHGLDSFLQDDRRAVLQQYATIYAPVLDYKNTPNLFEKLQEMYHDVDAIIGSSAGGLVTYYLAQALQKPCLLFNPALTFRSEMPIATRFNRSYTQYMQIVIGLQDEVLPSWQSLELLRNDISENQNIEIHLINKMSHSYPIDIFRKETEFFIKMIHQNL
ncbi:YqiA/YcfP family alpha/beta fold hydrolase [Capnocytophaga canimorsus]|uniref:YqiA/YcfP family alpha/beta fold hydrolase n=1 Tax=Capnocytophaga canimorsus TaxID=28188 RepID=UPI000D6E193B|nr:YqiA/YcfP family alpha/beta fold hydrolase [Capnocytophaga canimorsus]AWL79126.1 alpha/beta hydrolase [Capnocytophaga canimorsus]AYW37722.1 alpha/beta hydrolase [Capnocytophaga canimorsus]MDT9500539.1 alpha/beta hydrolase [Capnocytophaga canimorsus]